MLNTLTYTTRARVVHKLICCHHCTCSPQFMRSRVITRTRVCRTTGTGFFYVHGYKKMYIFKSYHIRKTIPTCQTGPLLGYVMSIMWYHFHHAHAPLSLALQKKKKSNVSDIYSNVTYVVTVLW